MNHMIEFIARKQQKVVSPGESSRSAYEGSGAGGCDDEDEAAEAPAAEPDVAEPPASDAPLASRVSSASLEALLPPPRPPPGAGAGVAAPRPISSRSASGSASRDARRRRLALTGSELPPALVLLDDDPCLSMLPDATTFADGPRITIGTRIPAQTTQIAAVATPYVVSAARHPSAPTSVSRTGPSVKAPTPEPATVMPVAVPRRRVKYCCTEHTAARHVSELPIPIRAPKPE